MLPLYYILLVVSIRAQYSPPLLPPYAVTYNMASSTAVMICNYTGYQTTDSTKGWGIVDFDWSNYLSGWSASVPMDTNERLLVQASVTRQAQPDTHVWIYRNSVCEYY